MPKFIELINASVNSIVADCSSGSKPRLHNQTVSIQIWSYHQLRDLGKLNFSFLSKNGDDYSAYL